MATPPFWRSQIKSSWCCDFKTLTSKFERAHLTPVANDDGFVVSEGVRSLQQVNVQVNAQVTQKVLVSLK